METEKIMGFMGFNILIEYKKEDHDQIKQFLKTQFPDDDGDFTGDGKYYGVNTRSPHQWGSYYGLNNNQTSVRISELLENNNNNNNNNNDDNDNISFEAILKGKRNYYGDTEAAIEFAADEYSLLKRRKAEKNIQHQINGIIDDELLSMEELLLISPSNHIAKKITEVLTRIKIRFKNKLK